MFFTTPFEHSLTGLITRVYKHSEENNKSIGTVTKYNLKVY